jgi:hypothetical protein
MTWVAIVAKMRCHVVRKIAAVGCQFFVSMVWRFVIVSRWWRELTVFCTLLAQADDNGNRRGRTEVESIENPLVEQNHGG